MFLCLGVALLSIIVIANYYIGPYCYCKKLRQHDDGSEFTEDNESTIFRIRVPYSERNCCSCKISSNVSDRKESSTNSDKTKEIKLVQEARPVVSEETRSVSAKLPHNRRRTAIWAPALKNQLDNITNSSSETCRSTRIVQAQIEARPLNITTNDTAESLRGDCVNSSQHSSRRNYLTDERTKKSKWKALICPRLEQLIVKDLKTNENRQKFRSQKLDQPIQTLNYFSPIRHPMTLQKHLPASISTSTKVSVNGSNLRPTDDEAVAKNDSKMEEYDGISKKYQNDHPSIANLNEKSICNLTINDIAMNQAQLLDIFESTRMSTSVITTTEASIISIKFYRKENNNVTPRKKDTLFCESPFLRLFTSLPGMLENFFAKLFSSQKAPKNPMPSIRVSDYSKTDASTGNETLYTELPNDRKRFTGNESVYDRRTPSIIFHHNEII